MGRGEFVDALSARSSVIEVLESASHNGGDQMGLRNVIPDRNAALGMTNVLY